MRVKDLLDAIKCGYVDPESEVVLVDGEFTSHHYPVMLARSMNLCQWEYPSRSESFLVLQFELSAKQADDPAARR